MKRIVALVLLVCLVFALTACSSQQKTEAPAREVLVAYFSCTGNTARVAGHIADILNVDLYEIAPEQPYTSADLEERNDNSSRSMIEQNDDAARPAISGSVENMEDYSVIFLGYPIWWGEAPKIIHTFLESYDFSNKTIIPFCTSGSVGVGSSAANLHSSASARWLDGMRFPANTARQAVVEWIDELPVKINP